MVNRINSLSTYHLYGKPGNSGENSKGTVHPGGNFSEKKVLHFEVLPFYRFYRHDRNVLYHLSGLLVPGCISRESEKFIVFCKWYNSIPFLFSAPNKNTSTIWPKFFTEISVQMVSAPFLRSSKTAVLMLPCSIFNILKWSDFYCVPL